MQPYTHHRISCVKSAMALIIVLLSAIGLMPIHAQTRSQQSFQTGLPNQLRLYSHSSIAPAAQMLGSIETTKTLFAGMNDVNYLWTDPATIASRMWNIQNAGSKWIRVTFYWENIETSKNSYNWSKIDAIRDEADRKGVTILPVLYGFPGWTYRRSAYINDPINCLDTNQFNSTKCQNYSNGSYNYKLYQYLTPNQQDFVDFIKAVVSRYKNNFKYWEIWNEPNWCINGNSLDSSGRCWASPEASVFGNAMKAIYPAIKSIDPSAKVILGGLSYSDLDFLHKYYAATAGYATFDILALHPYIPGSPYTQFSCGNPWPGYSRYNNNYNWCNWSGIIDIRNEMYWAGDIDKPIWLTEFGWCCTSDQNRATWLREALQKTGKDLGFVEKIFYFTWSDHPGYRSPAPQKGECPSDGFGLLGLDSSCTEYARGALDVYAEWARESQRVTIEVPSFNQNLSANGWYKFTGDFKDTNSYTPAQVRLVLDGYEITSYDIQFETVNNVKKWYFWIQPGPWLQAFGTSGLAEHTVALKVSCAGWCGVSVGTFYTSQSFRVSFS